MPTLAAAAGLSNLDGHGGVARPCRAEGDAKDIVDKLNKEVVHILAEPDVREKFDKTGNFAVSSSPEDFDAFIHKEAARWEKVLKDANIKYD